MGIRVQRKARRGGDKGIIGSYGHKAEKAGRRTNSYMDGLQKREDNCPSGNYKRRRK